MTKFVKLNRWAAEGEIRPMILNTDKIESITRLNNKPHLICIETDGGDAIHIHEDDWPMLGIDLVQELHSGRRVDQGKSDHLVDATLYAFAATDLCQGELAANFTEQQVADIRQGAFSHKFGTQQYVKDTGVKDES